MAEILELVAKIIIIISGGINAIEATMKVAKESGIDFEVLFNFVPKKWK